MNSYRNTQTTDPITLNNTHNIKNNDPRLFVFVQNGIRYKWLENSMLNLFARERKKIKNPMTRVPLSSRTINRLEAIYNKKRNNARSRFVDKLIKGNFQPSSNNENSNFNN